MQLRKFKPLTSEIDELERLSDCLDESCEPEVPSPIEQILYWKANTHYSEQRSAKKK